MATLNNELRKQMKVRSFYLGGSAKKSGFMRLSFRILTNPFYLVSRKFFKIVGNKKGLQFVERIYIKLDAHMMDRDKRTRLRLGGNYASRGGVTIYERFPLFSPYGDGFMGDYQITTEHEPALVVLIAVSAEVAEQRRPGDPKERLEAKVRAFNDFGGMEGSYKGKILHLDGTKPTLQSVGLILQHLNTLISKKL